MSTDCGGRKLPFKTAEANAKSWMRSEGFINNFLEITAAPEEKEKEFFRIAESLKKQGIQKYGILTDWVYMAGQGKITVNREAFKAADVLNGVIYNNEVDPSKYLDSRKDQNLYDVDDENFFQAQDTPQDDFDIESTTDTNIRASLPRLLQLKEKLAAIIRREIAEMNSIMENFKEDKEVYTKALKRRGELQKKLDGTVIVNSLGIDPVIEKGLLKEIEELKAWNSHDPAMFGPMIESELHRLEKIMEHDLDSSEKIEEANLIIDFVLAMNNFDRQFVEKDNHPIYHAGELYVGETLVLTDTDREYYARWAVRAYEAKSKLFSAEKREIERRVNSDVNVQKMFDGKQFTFEEITELKDGLKDIDWISSAVLDITSGYMTHNGMLPHVMLKMLSDALADAQIEQRALEETLDQTVEKAQEVLSSKKFEGGKYRLASLGIIGIKGVSWSLYWQEGENGLRTGFLVNKLSSKWMNLQEEIEKKYRKMTYGPKTKAELDLANKKRNDWLTENAKLIQSSLLPEIRDEVFKVPPAGQENPLAVLQKYFQAPDNQQKATQHKAELISIIGEEYYKERVEKQKELLLEFVTQREIFIESKLKEYAIPAGATEQDLRNLYPDLDKAINFWEAKYDPFIAEEYSKTGYPSSKAAGQNHSFHSYYTYNQHIPLRHKPDASGSMVETGFYDNNFELIENNQALLDFYRVARKWATTMRNNFGLGIKKMLPEGFIPFMERTLGEQIWNSGEVSEMLTLAGKIKAIYTHVFDYLKMGMGVREEDTFDYAERDPLTGKKTYKINDTFIKQSRKKTENAFALNQAVFVKNYKGLRGRDYLGLIKRNSKRMVYIDHPDPKFNNADAMAQLISPYLGLETPLTGKELIERYGVLEDRDRSGAMKATIPLGEILYDFSQHQVVQEQSFDLPKIIRFYGKAAADYKARTTVLPTLAFMKRYYEEINDIETTNTGEQKKGNFRGREKPITRGFRKNAIAQLESWFNMRVLGDESIDHFGTTTPSEKNINDEASVVKRTLKGFGIGKKMMTAREVELSKQIDELLLTEKNVERIETLNTIKKGLGRVVAVSAILESIGTFLRTKGLAVNLNSATTNLVEGQLANGLMAETWDDPDSINTVTLSEIVASDLRKKVGANGIEKVLIVQHMQDFWNLLQDSSNDLQRSTIKSSLSKIDKYGIYYPQRKTESYNQIPLIAAKLKQFKIKDKDGNEAPILDATGENSAMEWNFEEGRPRLKAAFRTKENIDNWEHANGKQFKDFQSETRTLIRRTHGDFDPITGQRIKRNVFGKLAMMFKTWLPMEVWKRIAAEHVDIMGGTRFKGRWRSHTMITASLMGAIGVAPFLGILPGAITAGTIGAIAGRAVGKKPSIGVLKELLYVTKIQIRKLIGLPVNYTSRIFVKKDILGTRLTKKEFAKMQNEAKKQGFDELDFKNWQSNMQEISNMLVFLALILFVKGLTWDDDDDEEDPRRYTHNMLINMLINFAGNQYSFINPATLYKDHVAGVAIVRFIGDIEKTLRLVEPYLNDEDYETKGIHRGEHRFPRQLRKTFLPSLFREPWTLGFGTLMEDQFTPLPMDKMFYSEDKKDKTWVMQQRAKYDLMLEKEMGITDEAKRKKMLDYVFKKKQDKKKDINESYTDVKNRTENVEEEQLLEGLMILDKQGKFEKKKKK
jgi:hypothetical protein